MRIGLAGLLALAVCGGAVVGHAQMTTIPLWAYGYIAYPAMPGDYTMKCQGERADPCDRPGGLPTDPNNTPRTLTGSDRTFSVAQINARYNPCLLYTSPSPRDS